MQATALKEQLKGEFIDPVCGMTVVPARAAGTSERNGVRYYFCSPGCKQKFDAAGAGVSVPQASCCGAAEAPAQFSAAPVQLTLTRESYAGPAKLTGPRHAHDQAQKTS
jgi:YHS domain-containing protein